MEILRHVVLLVHLVGFAILFGAWVVEAAARRFQATRLMDLGLLIAFLAGVVLCAPFGRDYDFNWAKIGIKLGILVVIGALAGISRSRAKKNTPLPTWTFWLIGALILTNAALAVIWR